MLSSRLMVAFLLLNQLALAGAGAQRYAFHEDGENEGLNSLTVNAMLQDRTGFLWVGTENGLYEFDGSTYTRIGAAQGLLGTYINSIYEDAAGELWVGTNTNIYHGDGRRFTAVVAEPHGVAGSAGQQLTSTGAGQMLAVSQSHLLRMVRAGPARVWTIEPFFSAASLTSYPQLELINSVYADRSGTVWLGCGEAICEVSGSRVKVWGTKQGTAADTWSWFLEDSKGRLWARGSHHIRMLNPGSLQFDDEDIVSTPVSFAGPFLPLAEDSRHRILTRTDHGLAIWCQGHWQTIGVANGLKTPGILSMLVDSNGALWLGTYGKGIQRWLGYGKWETWTAGQTPDENPVVWSMIRDGEGTLWAGTETGVDRFDRALGRFVAWQPNAAAPRQPVLSALAARDGSVWFSSNGDHLLHYDPRNGRMQHWNMPVQLRQVRQDTSGRVWIMAGDGIYYYDPSARKVNKLRDPSIPEARFSDACEDPRHGLWFATASGLVSYASGKWGRVPVHAKDAVDGFSAVACESDGTLWLGGTTSSANTGMARFRVSGNVAIPTASQPPSWMDSVEVLFLRRDRRGWLWVGSGSGVYVFNGSNWRHITAKDGLAWDDCAENAFLEDTDGSIWIGTSNGLSHLLHPEDVFTQRPLSIIAVNATLGDTEIPASGFPSLPWTREPFRVRMASSAIADQSSILYHYRLDGLEDDWASTRSQDLHYPSLPDGKYRLKLYAEDAGRGLRSPLVVISFRMRPPWWKNIPFKLTVSALVLVLVFLLLRFRDRALIARQAHLEGLVRQRTAELEIEKQQLMDAREALREQACRDALTGLLNYGAIHDILDREMARSRRDGSIITAVMIDLDLFKGINDMYGHMAGDEVLREVARRLTDSIRPYDVAGRYGGEEFLLVMPDFDAGRDPDRLAAIHDAICLDPIELSESRVTITCSFGVSVLYGDQGISAEKFLDRADKALYKAKRSGRNRIDFDVPTMAG